LQEIQEGIRRKNSGITHPDRGMDSVSRRRLSPKASWESVACNLRERPAAACACGARGSSPLPTRGICPVYLPNVTYSCQYFILSSRQRCEDHVRECSSCHLANFLLYKHRNCCTLGHNHSRGRPIYPVFQ
jgi:hypothetical protein